VSLSTEHRAGRVDVPESPPATRHRSVRWRDPRLVVGVALVAVSALLGAALLDGGDDTASVWAVRRALGAGQPVTSADLVPRDVGFGDAAAADHYVSASSPFPEGAVLTRDVGAGELLPRAALGSDAPALVEVPLTVPAEAVPATVRVGSVVDVWATPDPDLAAADAEDAESTLVFAGVTVVAVSRSGGALGPTPTRQVIVGVEDSVQDYLPTALAELARGSVVLVRKP
jgi:hypothetical protein